MDIPVALLTGSGGLSAALWILYWGLSTGRISTRKEVDGKDDEIRWLRETNIELTSQITTLIVERSSALEALDALRRAAEGSIPK